MPETEGEAEKEALPHALREGAAEPEAEGEGEAQGVGEALAVGVRVPTPLRLSEALGVPLPLPRALRLTEALAVGEPLRLPPGGVGVAQPRGEALAVAQAEAGEEPLGVPLGVPLLLRGGVAVGGALPVPLRLPVTVGALPEHVGAPPVCETEGVALRVGHQVTGVGGPL